MRTRGFTLLELLVVAVVLTVVAAIVALGPGREPPQRALGLAAGEVAAALRFARSEAARTGQPHGVRVTAADSRLRVYRLDTAASPPTELFDVRHAVDKRLYDVVLDALPHAGGASVTLSSFAFSGSAGSLESVAFDTTGAPVSPVTLQELTTGHVDLQRDGLTRSVVLAPATGRVTLP